MVYSTKDTTVLPSGPFLKDVIDVWTFQHIIEGLNAVWRACLLVARRCGRFHRVDVVRKECGQGLSRHARETNFSGASQAASPPRVATQPTAAAARRANKRRLRLRRAPRAPKEARRRPPRKPSSERCVSLFVFLGAHTLLPLSTPLCAPGKIKDVSPSCRATQLLWLGCLGRATGDWRCGRLQSDRGPAAEAQRKSHHRPLPKQRVKKTREPQRTRARAHRAAACEDEEEERSTRTVKVSNDKARARTCVPRRRALFKPLLY